jgi:hypothetical protein
VRICRLTLILGVLGEVEGCEEGDGDEEDEGRGLDWEHHRRAMVIAAESSSVRRPHSQVHGVESMLRGRFWAARSNSKTKSDCDEVDQLSCSLHKMSISSPVKSSGFESSVNADLQSATGASSLRIESRGGLHSVSSSNISNGSSPNSVFFCHGRAPCRNQGFRLSSP